MEALLDLLRHLGVPALNLATLAFLFVAVRYIEKLRRMPEQPLSRGEFKKELLVFERKLAVRFGQIENNQTTFSGQWSTFQVERDHLRILWEHSELSKPRHPAMREVMVQQVAYVERVQDVERPRFRTGENPIFVPSTDKPPPRGMEGRERRDALRPSPTKSYAFDEEDVPFDEDSSPPTTPTEPQGRKRK